MMTRDDLGTAYCALIGYNPFEENPNANTLEIMETLRDYLSAVIEAEKPNEP